MNTVSNIVQGVLSYEERLECAREEVRLKRRKHGALLIVLNFGDLMQRNWKHSWRCMKGKKGS